MQHLHEQLAFLQSRYAKDYQKFAAPDEPVQWPVDNPLFGGEPSLCPLAFVDNPDHDYREVQQSILCSTFPAGPASLHLLNLRCMQC